MAYHPIDIESYMETPDNPTRLRDIYVQPHVCLENAFSTATMIAIHSDLRRKSLLIDTTIRTGGGRNGVAYPTLQVERGNPRHATIRSNNQFKLSGDVGRAVALQEVRQYYQQHSDVLGSPPATLNACNVSMSSFMWRFTHRLPDGSFPLIPVSVEISHLAEGYSAAHRDNWGAAKVEITQLEGHVVNESRKVCTDTGSMWLKAGTREVIRLDEHYTGPSACPHAALGSPCYAPYPAGFKNPTGITPNPRKLGKKGKRTGSGGESGGKKKSQTVSSKDQRRLSFSAA